MRQLFILALLFIVVGHIGCGGASRTMRYFLPPQDSIDHEIREVKRLKIAKIDGKPVFAQTESMIGHIYVHLNDGSVLRIPNTPASASWFRKGEEMTLSLNKNADLIKIAEVPPDFSSRSRYAIIKNN
jgi:hypothetical protein